MAYDIIVVGTSWGGLSAVTQLISDLPSGFGIPVVVVQHRHRESGHLLAAILQDRTALSVSEIEDKTSIAAGCVFIAPADYHLLVEPGFFSLSTDEPVRYSRPSIDVTFASTADTYGARAIGVVLTGANGDGSRGLKRIVDRGGLAFVQSPETAESPTMPVAALRCVPNSRALSIPKIAAALIELSKNAAASPRARAR